MSDIVNGISSGRGSCDRRHGCVGVHDIVDALEVTVDRCRYTTAAGDNGRAMMRSMWRKHDVRRSERGCWNGY